MDYCDILESIAKMTKFKDGDRVQVKLVTQREDLPAVIVKSESHCTYRIALADKSEEVVHVARISPDKT